MQQPIVIKFVTKVGNNHACTSRKLKGSKKNRL